MREVRGARTAFDQHAAAVARDGADRQGHVAVRHVQYRVHAVMIEPLRGDPGATLHVVAMIGGHDVDVKGRIGMGGELARGEPGASHRALPGNARICARQIGEHAQCQLRPASLRPCQPWQHGRAQSAGDQAATVHASKPPKGDGGDVNTWPRRAQAGL